MLKTEGLTLHYGGSQILYGIDMEARAGEVTCIMGTNGVGKTSLFKALAGTHARSGGGITIDGEEIGKLRPQDIASDGVYVTSLDARAQSLPETRVAQSPTGTVVPAEYPKLRMGLTTSPRGAPKS